MASPQLCEIPEHGPAEYIVSMISQAEVAGFCLACFADFAQAYLQAVAPDRLAPPPKAAPRRSRKATAAAAADANEGGGQDDATGQEQERAAAGIGQSPSGTAD